MVKQIIHILCMMIIALSLSITVIFFLSPTIYSLLNNYLSLNEVVSLTPEALESAYQAIIIYLVNPIQDTLTIPYFDSSLQGLHHFYDVKNLVQINFIVSLMGLIALPFILKSFKKTSLSSIKKYGFTFMYCVPLIFLFILTLFFDYWFLVFHKFLFSNDYWLFDPALDPIILVLPSVFFFILFVGVILIYEGIVFLIQTIYRIIR